MELDAFTVALEILNFLVLLWILKRFLYKPIKAAIAQRQRVLEQGLKDAQTREQAAAALEREHTRQLEQWQTEKAQQQVELQQALARERDIAMAKIRDAADAEKRRLDTLRQQECDQIESQLRRQATQTALQLSQRLLERLASEALDELLANLLQQDLQTLPAEEREALQHSLQQQQGNVIVVSAHPLTATAQQVLQQTLTDCLQQSVILELQLEPALISGVRISIGARILHANLADELAFFQRGLNHDGA